MDFRVTRSALAVVVALAGCADDTEGTSANGGSASSGSTTTDSSPPSTASTGSATTLSGSSTTDPTPGEGSTSGDASSESGVQETDGPMQCEPIPTCEAPLPNAGPELDWERTQSSVLTASGSERHRGYDMFYNPDEWQWVMAKFAYGPTDWDLAGEQVDLFLLEGCEGEFEPLGSVFTTDDGDHPTIHGVVDSGGWVYFELPEPLPLGRHRIHMVVRGDGSRADTIIEVVEPGTPMFLSDIDGTLTTFEFERFIDLLLDTVPDINAGATDAFQLLVDLGYRPMYLTARPEFLAKRTDEFLVEHGLPPGIVRTTQSATGALGDDAVAYKSGQLAALADRGLVPAFAFGNTDSDSEAYESAGIELDRRFFVQFDDPLGGRRIEDYTELLSEFGLLESVCE
ncbi:MAG: LNS2 domain-containing protein [Nannocystales bacterium]